MQHHCGGSVLDWELIWSNSMPPGEMGLFSLDSGRMEKAEVMVKVMQRWHMPELTCCAVRASKRGSLAATCLNRA